MEDKSKKIGYKLGEIFITAATACMITIMVALTVKVILWMF